MFLGTCTDSSLTVFCGDTTDAYAHSSAPNDTYLAVVDDVYAEWYKDIHNIEINKRQVLHVYHALQGHSESGKVWMRKSL